MPPRIQDSIVLVHNKDKNYYWDWLCYSTCTRCRLRTDMPLMSLGTLGMSQSYK